MSGRVSSLRGALREGGRLHGTFVKLPAAEVVEIAAETLDFVVVDLEHSQLSEGDVLRLVRHAWALGFPALVRIHELDRALVNRVLEAGAAGIQLSSVRSSAEVEALRDACLYAPGGTRSVSLAHGPARYGATSLAEYLSGVEAPLLVAQIETLETEDPLEAILTAGADVAFVGVTDLAVEYGLDEQRVRARIDEVAAAADAAGVAFGGFGDDERYRYAIASSDLALLRKAYAGG
jgi:4-hydroxy-2-oxoheptanedioate aldolase